MTLSNIESIIAIYPREKHMENQKVNLYLTQFRQYIPRNKIFNLKNILIKADDSIEDNLSLLSLHNPTLVLVLSIFLGSLGVDRFMLGDYGLGICKLLFSWLTFGIWPLVDIYFSYQKAKDINYKKLYNAIKRNLDY